MWHPMPGQASVHLSAIHGREHGESVWSGSPVSVRTGWWSWSLVYNARCMYSSCASIEMTLTSYRGRPSLPDYFAFSQCNLLFSFYISSSYKWDAVRFGRVRALLRIVPMHISRAEPRCVPYMLCRHAFVFVCSTHRVEERLAVDSIRAIGSSTITMCTRIWRV